VAGSALTGIERAVSQPSLTLVVGASGYLGSEIARQAEPHVLNSYCRRPIARGVAYDFFAHSMGQLLSEHPRIRTVIFASAVEIQPTDDDAFFGAVERFVQGVRQHHVRLVYISSDAVFAGTRGGYTEQDAPDATTLYGRHLAAFEQAVTTQLDDYAIVRVSYLYGNTQTHTDRRITAASAALTQGQLFPRYANVFKSPVHVSRAAREVVRLAQSPEVGIRHIAAARCSIYDFYVEQCSFMGEAVRLITPSTAVAAEVDGLDTSLAHDPLIV